MAPSRSDRPHADLVPRICSAILLAPPLLAAIHFGSIWYEIMVVGVCGIMTWEWHRLCSGTGALDITAGIMGAGVSVTLALVLFSDEPMAAIAAGCAGAIGVAGFCWRRGRAGTGIFLALGTAATAFVAVSCLWMRTLDDGRVIVLWLIGVVWFTDIGAYAVGRLVGGLRLAPGISPGKTWSGLVGGAVAASLWSAFWIGRNGDLGAGVAIAAAVAFALLAQAGDLGVSAVKRRFGAKDTGRLIPGHGGILDRTDGLLLTGPALALVLLYSGLA